MWWEEGLEDGMVRAHGCGLVCLSTVNLRKGVKRRWGDKEEKIGGCIYLV